MATTATIATATIIARFLFGLMGRGWRYGKNLFAMFNSGCIDAVRHSLRHNSYECYRSCCGGEVVESGGLTLSVQDAPFSSGRTRGALGPGEPAAPRAGAPAGWGIWPPPRLAYKSSWAGLSGPGPGGRQLSRACPSARRGRVSIREETFPYITIHCLIYGSRRCNSTCAPASPRYTNSKYRSG
jgi:hypothetical protein